MNIKSKNKTICMVIALVMLCSSAISCAGSSSGAQQSSSSPDYTLIHTTIQQPVDHNNPGSGTFDERVDIIVPAGASLSSPVFFELGLENNIDGWLTMIYTAYGSPKDVIFIMAEHRGYGKSITQDADQSVPSYVRIDQALADYHHVVQQLNTKYTGPWMAAGHSYGGGLVINFAAVYTDDVKVVLSSGGVVDWPFTMDAYDRQVRITMGDETYQRLVAHVKNLEPKQLFDQNWMEREFLTAVIHGMTQDGQYRSLLPVFRFCAALPTSSFLGILHALDSTVAKNEAWKYAVSNSKKTLTHDEAMTGNFRWRVWRYQQCTEVGIFEVSSQPGGVFTRSRDDFIAESKALFGEEPKSAVNPAWSPRAMLDKLTVPLVYVGGGMDPWMGLGISRDYVIKNGKYFYRPEDQHCPDFIDVHLSQQILAQMLKYARAEN
jgi:pimeloyl-ACP methyl ester carboxylesterase